MKRIIAALALCALSGLPALAQVRYGFSNTSTPAYTPYGASPYLTTPYVNPYGYSPYRTYGGYYGSGYGVPGVGLPIYGIPQPINGNFFGISAGGTTFNMWRAPSGYYYPWYYSQMGISQAPIVIVQNGSTQQALPPLSTVFSDMLKYLDEQKAAGKLTDAQFTHLKQRCLDLISKERDLRTQGSGSLDPEFEREIRADADSLGGEVARSVKP